MSAASSGSSGPAPLTAEIRFWWPDRQTGILSAWLDEQGITLSEACQRTDLYIPTGSMAVNLKKRDGEQLELKALVRQLPLAHAFAGQHQCEIWVKHRLTAQPILANREVRISKTRWLACLDDRGVMVTDQHLSTGCQVELSEVRPEGGQRTWTSFCLEVFGDGDSLPELMQNVTGKLGDMPCAHERPLVASYAEWLFREDYFDRE